MKFFDQLRSLDPRDVGRWPLPVRGFFIAVIFALVAAFGWYMFVWDDDRPVLQKAQADELDLRSQFENKQQRAANLDAYKAQLAEMERSFGAMLRQLPGKTEVPNLLVDISQTGLAAGLQEKLFQPGSEKSSSGTRGAADQDQAGGLVSRLRQFCERHRGIAAHRYAAGYPDHARVDAKGGYDNLTMDVTAKTYRYIEGEGGAEAGEEEDGRQVVKTKGNAAVVCAVLAALGLAGCSGGQSDLQKWIEATKKKPGGRIQALPEVKPYETYVYNAQKMRSPFQPQGAGGSGQASLRPSSRRNREFLEGFSLDTLKMVGTFKVGSSFYGLVQSKDGLVHKVQPGNYLGQNDGKVTEITGGKISRRRNHTGWSRRLYRATGLIGIVRLRVSRKRKKVMK